MASLMVKNFEQKALITTLQAQVQDQETRLKHIEIIQTPHEEKLQQIQQLHESIFKIKVKQSTIIS